MKLYFSPASPFAAKVRMAAHHCGIALDCVVVDTAAEPADLVTANPLGKIPALIADDGLALYDSQVICEYFDRLSGGRLIPQSDKDWLAVKRMEATADGTTDAAILTVYEKRYRPEELWHQPWVDKQWRKAWRGFGVIEASIGGLPQSLTIGHFAVAGLLGWFELRFGQDWRATHPALAGWYAAFPQVFPAFEEFKPRA